MSLIFLLDIFCEFTEPILELVEQRFIQHNLFEKADELCLSFNGFIVLRLYKQRLEQLYYRFKSELNEGVSPYSTPEVVSLLSELRLGVKEMERRYYKERLGNKDIYLHDRLCLDARLSEQQEWRLKVRVSEFLSAQRNTLRMAKELIDLRIKMQGLQVISVAVPSPKTESELAFDLFAGMSSNLLWDANDTDLLELATSLYESQIVKARHGKLTKKALLTGLEQLFNTKVKDADVKLSRRCLERLNQLLS